MLNKETRKEVKKMKKMTEEERIRELREEHQLICYNAKGRLCFRQRHPDFPIWFSLVTLIICIILFAIRLWLMILH